MALWYRRPGGTPVDATHLDRELRELQWATFATEGFAAVAEAFAGSLSPEERANFLTQLRVERAAGGPRVELPARLVAHLRRCRLRVKPPAGGRFCKPLCFVEHYFLHHVLGAEVALHQPLPKGHVEVWRPLEQRWVEAAGEAAEAPSRKRRREPPQKPPREAAADACFVCMEPYGTHRRVAAVPCGHLGVCGRCAGDLRNTCPFCRRRGVRFMTLYDP